MKPILFLFTATLLALACSNDDKRQPEEQSVLIIKKLSKVFFVEDGTSNKLDYLYDESGKRTKWAQNYYDKNVLLHNDYLYNSLGQILEAKTTNILENIVIRTIT